MKKLFNNKIVRLFLIFTTLYTSILVHVKLRKSYLRKEFQEARIQFDKNHNGVIDEQEKTVEFWKALEKASGTTGLDFAPYTGLVYSALLTVFIYFVFKKRINGVK